MNRSWDRILLAAAAMAFTAGVVQAGPIYSYNWAIGDEGHSCNSGGVINWVNAEFDTNTNHLKWYTNLGNGGRLRSDGFTIALSPAGEDLGEGETAMLFFDGNSPAVNPSLRPALTAYGYNGVEVNDLPGYSSYYDGQSAAGVQSPDRIASSLAPTTDWIHDLTYEVNADGSRTMGFEIDVTPLLGHAARYPAADGAWNPTPFGETLGIWMGTFSGLSAGYSDGYLTDWSPTREGFLHTTALASVTDPEQPTDPVPEPATLTLLGLGAASMLGARRRKKNARTPSQV